MGVIYFLICVRKHKSDLPTNIRRTVGEENTMIYRKMCFLLPKCAFFYQWCLSCFPSEHYVSMFFVLQTVLVKKYTPCQGMI